MSLGIMPSVCRSSRISPMMSEASSVNRSTRETSDELIFSAAASSLIAANRPASRARGGRDVLDALVFADQLRAGDRLVVPAHAADGDLPAVELLAKSLDAGQRLGLQPAIASSYIR
jgi:hypothetical protein